MKKIKVKIEADKLKKKLNVQEPDTPMQVRDKLETLKDNERLDVSAIKGLEDKIKVLEEKVAQKNNQRVLAGPSANSILAHFFTSDGTRSYSVPRHRRAIMLIGTQAPIMFKKNTDFTTANTTLTISSAITDVAGQEYVFLYQR